MRPGQAAPEFKVSIMNSPPQFGGFNEAGAGCPGIRGLFRIRPLEGCGFNEAGAGCPGIRRSSGLFRPRTTMLQ